VSRQLNVTSKVRQRFNAVKTNQSIIMLNLHHNEVFAWLLSQTLERGEVVLVVNS
jgi:hypothetical protein